MKSQALLLLVIMALFSCRKTTKDFVGEYSFKNCNKVNLEDENESFWFSPSSIGRSKKKRKIPRTTEILVYLLTDCRLELFIDESSQVLKGEFEAAAYRNRYYNKSALEKMEIALELKNFRIINDTLWFSISIPQQLSVDKSIKGHIFIKDNRKLVGLDQKLTGNLDFNKYNPWVVSLDEDITTFLSYNSTDSATSFYEKQVEHFTKSLEDEALSTDEKHILENSIEYIRETYFN